MPFQVAVSPISKADARGISPLQERLRLSLFVSYHNVGTQAGFSKALKQIVLIWLLCIVALLSLLPEAIAQAPTNTKQVKTAPLSFDVASVRENKSGASLAKDSSSSNVPLGPGNVYSPNGGLFLARDMKLVTYIAFAYKMTDSQLSAFQAKAPDWVNQDRFDIQARTEKRGVTKDDLRLMMQSLLGERFGLAAHYETKLLPVFALTLITSGKTGPDMRTPASQEGCHTTLPGKAPESGPPPPETVSGGFPYTCGGVILLRSSAAGRVKIGGRDISLALLANSLTGWGQLHRPVADRTGITGNIDFTLEYVPESSPTFGAADSADAGITGPDFREALKQQLGLKLVSEKGETRLILLDHIDHLDPN